MRLPALDRCFRPRRGFKLQIKQLWEFDSLQNCGWGKNAQPRGPSVEQPSDRVLTESHEPLFSRRPNDAAPLSTTARVRWWAPTRSKAARRAALHFPPLLFHDLAKCMGPRRTGQLRVLLPGLEYPP